MQLGGVAASFSTSFTVSGFSREILIGATRVFDKNLPF
jgi:hypothetical protein